MAAQYFFREFTPTQQETLARAIAAHQAHLDTLKAGLPLKGGMHWKKIQGKEYLYKYRDRLGNGESLGPRTPVTERLYTEFREQRAALAARQAAGRENLAAASRFCRAALIHRVPETVSRIMRHLEVSDLATAPLMVIDAHALHAFEFAAEVFIDVPKASPFWVATGQRLTFAAAAPPAAEALLALLRQADRSFQIRPGDDFQAVNKTGFVVELKYPPVLRGPSRPGRFDASRPAVPAESGDLTAVLSAPKFSQVVISQRGTPATLVVPDPRALALHKLWLSQQDDRDPDRRAQDRMQASALVELILRYLPQYDFFSSQLHLFPPEVTRQAQSLMEGYEFEP